MKHVKVVGLLALLVLAPLAQAQWIDDPDDDAQESIGVAPADHGRAGAAELHAVDIEESDDAIVFTVLHGDLPQPTIPVVDAVGYDLDFLIDDMEYTIRASYSVPVGGEPRHFAWLYADGFDQRSELDAEAVEGGFTITVPKDLIRDQHGSRPRAGMSLSEFTIQADQQSIGTICVMECTSTGPQTQDRAPDEGTASYDFRLGLAQDGDILLSSPAPVRWSNGEATTFVYEVVAQNLGDSKDTVTFLASEVPAGWQLADLGPVELQAGEERAIPVPVRVPFAHAHGSDPRFLLEAFGTSGTGRIELGVHYPEIPQPTGHHAQVTIHTREQPTFIFEEVVFNAVGGGLGEVAYMNTADQHDGDESVPVMGSKGTIGAEIDGFLDGEVPEYGVIYDWVVPLAPGLRVGMQVDGTNVTEGEVELGFDVPVGDVRVFGRLAVLSQEDMEDMGPLANDYDEYGDTLATIPQTELHSVSGTVMVPITMEAEDRVVPFDPDQELVLFLSAHVIRPDIVLTPNTGVYLTEGEMVLPLKEYHDSVPVDVELPEVEQQEAEQSLDAPQATEEVKDTPAVGALPLLTGLGIAAWRRREH